MDDSKLNRKMASAELAVARGFTLNPETTFHQTGHRVLENTQSKKLWLENKNYITM